jgi:hypothetical protein
VRGEGAYSSAQCLWVPTGRYGAAATPVGPKLRSFRDPQGVKVCWDSNSVEAISMVRSRCTFGGHCAGGKAVLRKLSGLSEKGLAIARRVACKVSAVAKQLIVVARSDSSDSCADLAFFENQRLTTADIPQSSESCVKWGAGEISCGGASACRGTIRRTRGFRSGQTEACLDMRRDLCRTTRGGEWWGELGA